MFTLSGLKSAKPLATIRRFEIVMQTMTQDGVLLLQWQELDLTATGSPPVAVQMVSSAYQIAGGALTNAGVIATFTSGSSLPSWCVNGAMVAITGMSDANWNGYVQITIPPQVQVTANLPAAAKSFTYQMPAIPANATGTPVVSSLKARTALVQADAANAGNVTFGPNATGTLRSLTPGQEYVIPQSVANQGNPIRFDLALWYWIGSAAGDKLKILWLSIAFMLFFLTASSNAQPTGGGYTGGGGSSVNPTGNGSALTNLNPASLTGVNVYTNAQDTNSLIVFRAGSNCNGLYKFSVFNVGGSYPGSSIYTNLSTSPVSYLWYDPESDIAAITTNGTDYNVGNCYYSFENTINSLSDICQNNNWINGGGLVTDIGAFPVPVVVIGQKYGTNGASPTPFKNPTVYVDGVNGNDNPSPNGIFGAFKTVTNALNYAAYHPGLTVYVLGTNTLSDITFSIPDNTTLRGDSLNTSAVILATGGTSPFFNMGNNSSINNIFVNAYINILGTNDIMEDVELFGRIDALFFEPGFDRFYAQGCRFRSSADMCTTGVAAGSPTATFLSCVFDGNGGYTGGLHQNPIRDVSIGMGNFSFLGCSFSATDGGVTSNNVCLEITASTGNITVSGCTFYSHSLSGSTNYVFYNGAGANTNSVFESDNCIPNFSTNNVYGGNVIMLGSVPATNVVFSIIQTNFVSGKLYTNTYGVPILVSANATLVTTGVAGNATLSLLASTYLTNAFSVGTLLTSIAMPYTNVLSMVIPASQTYTFTNTSTGAGNSASVVGGQILVY